MSEEKLTVAELMARAGKKGESTDAPRRRRRRSLEEGGISVAELTGSIPAVKEKPAESKHSAIKIDDPAEKPVEKAVEKAESAPTPAAQPADKPAVTPAAPPVSATTEAEPAAKPAAKPAAQPVAKQPAAKPAEKSVDKAAKAAEKSEGATARPAPSNEETMVLSIVDEKDPIRLTTGAFPVVPASAVKSTAPEKSAVASKDGEAAADAEFAPEKDATGAALETGQLAAVTDTDLMSQNAEDAEVAEESVKTSVFSIILMAVVGVVLGAVVFLAFEMLWERLDNWLVGLLAIAVTLGMVGLVHALRTSRDGFSMILAGVVGLVMTLGPLLIVF